MTYTSLQKVFKVDHRQSTVFWQSFGGIVDMQEEADKRKRASQEEKKADLARRVEKFPKHLREAVAGTPHDDIFINHIGDRHALLTTSTHSSTAKSSADPVLRLLSLSIMAVTLRQCWPSMNSQLCGT